MTGSEAALKLKNLKGIHEDDGDHGESESGDQLPMDAQVMKFVLESMGAEKHDPRVVNQLQEFVHRTLCVCVFVCLERCHSNVVCALQGM